jgi:HD superfamily phosphohydrolase YqeK
LQRLNDNEDILHGKRSADWLEKNKKIFEEIIKETNFQGVLAAIKYHNLGNNKIPKKIHSKYSKIIGIIKTADALDRFRQPKKKWWVDPKRLKLRKASEFIPFARYLTIRSEYLALKKASNKTSLLKAMKDSKILIK